MSKQEKLADGAVKKHISVKCDYIHIEPGDGTRYELLVADWEDDYVMVSSTLTVTYWLLKGSIKEAYPYIVNEKTMPLKKWKDEDGNIQQVGQNMLDHPYIGYVADHMAHGSIPRNWWTARAIIIACYTVIKRWEGEKHGPMGK